MTAMWWYALAGLILLSSSELPEAGRASRAARAPYPEPYATCAVPAARLRAEVVAVHDKQRNVGVSVALRRGGELVFRADVGLAELEHGVPVDSGTVFGIASVTKLVTAAALLRLHDQRLVDPDAVVQRYVPEFTRFEAGDITLRMLVTHRSGIPHPQAQRTPRLFATHYETAADALEVFTDDTLVVAPGTRRVYSSSNYNLLAAVIERIHGAPFRQAMADLVLEPLGLAHTQLDDIRRPTPGRSGRYSFYHPWTYAEGDSLYVVPRWDYSFNSGGGGLSSKVTDLTAFAEALMEPGFLSGEALALLYDPAWFGRADAEGRLIFVTGSNPGVQAALAIDPDARIATAVLSNTWGVGSRSAEMVLLARKLTDLCAGRS